jgi:hypothetical protein
MNFYDIPELKVFKNDNDFIIKIKQTNCYSKKTVLFEDNNICLNKLFTTNNIIIGYMLSYKGDPRTYVRPLSSFIFYSSVSEIENDKELEIIYDDKLVRLMSTRDEEKSSDYAFILKQRGKSLKENENISEENDELSK